jgi:hypothetical protein
MSDHLGLINGDEDMTRGLRALYAAPAGHAYWNELESRIMARVAEVELGWWDVLDRWAKPAMIAAAALIVGAGFAMYRANEGEKAMAYERIFTPPPVPGLPVDAGVRQIDQDEREKTLRSIFDRNRND